MSRDLSIFRGSNGVIQKYGRDAAAEAPSSGNVRPGSKADIQQQCSFGPLLMQWTASTTGIAMCQSAVAL